MSELVEWLTAILDEDERIAQEAEGDPPYTWRDVIDNSRAEQLLTDAQERHAHRHDPRSVLADIAAKRQIIELHPVCNSNIGTPSWCGHCQDSLPVHFPCPTIRALASAYAHRPGYRTEWRPTDA